MPSEQAFAVHRISTWLFLRLLGLIYLIAFLSFWVQASGLVGPQGILPLAPYLHAVAAQIPDKPWLALPTLSWMNPAQPPLASLAACGVGASVFLLLGLAPLPSLAALWLLYLSLVLDGQDFMGFQWDSLLLETGFAALLLAPWTLRSSLADDPIAPRAARWLLYWLLFRLILGSGVVKLTSGDPHWRDLSALNYHYWTQPLPLWTSWYAAGLPAWFQQGSCILLFAVELGTPFLMVLPATRRLACAGIVGLMLLISGTGNYCFFNLLTAALALLLLDDGAWPAWMRARLKASAARRPVWTRSLLATSLAAVLALISLAPFLAQLGFQPRQPGWLNEFGERASAFRSVNTYGLFAVMTTGRHEIVLEGSDDALHWKEYGFPWKPGDPLRRPGLVAPFQPRLDWQLWFAALGTPQDNPWFQRLCVRILQGSPDVLNLLSFNPFPGRPPRYLRARLYDYRFTDAKTRAATGAWWLRAPIGDYCPPVSLSQSPTPR